MAETSVLSFTSEQLLDKVINLTLYRMDGSFDQILTPSLCVDRCFGGSP